MNQKLNPIKTFMQTNRNDRFVLITEKTCVVYENSRLTDMGGQPKALAMFEIDESNQALTLADIEKIRTDNYDD